MKEFEAFIVILYSNVVIMGRVNVTNFFHGFDRNHSKLKDVCLESVHNCTRLSTIISNQTCLDIKLSYEYTYESTNYHIDLDKWVSIRAIPHCWMYLQKLLCSLKYPECTHSNSNWFVKKITQETCLVTKRECPFLMSQNKYENSSRLSNEAYPLVDQTPFFLNCDRYSTKCHIDSYKRLIDNKNSITCKWPMVKTTQPSLWIKGFTECSFHCKTPFFNKEEYQQTKSIFGILGIVFFVLNAFVLITFALHQKQHCKYKWHPLILNLFIFHVYMIISTFGWMIPLLPAIGHSVVCRNDGALQIRKPQVRVGEAIWCVVVFSIVYFPLLAASITSISFFYSILSVVRQYANCCSNNDTLRSNYSPNVKSSNLPFLTKKIGFSMRLFDDKVKKRFQDIEFSDIKTNAEDAEIKLKRNGLNWEHSVARNQILSGQLYIILISVALLVISLTVAEIRADPISGICFISSESVVTRICLSLMPLTSFLIVKSVLIYLVIKHFRIIQSHLTIYSSCQQEIHSKRISSTTRFYVFILLFLWTFWSFSIYTHWYIFSNESSWFSSLKRIFLCKLRQSLLVGFSKSDDDSESSVCSLETKPIINVFILHNLSYFSINVVYIFCSLFNRHTVLVWQKELAGWIYGAKKQSLPDEYDDSRNIFIGLQNKSLLDAIWNPGVFAYLVKNEKVNIKEENGRSALEEKSATIESLEDSSMSYGVYRQDGSLRSCTSLPPIKHVSRLNVCRFSEDLSKNSQIGTTLDDFLKVTRSFVDSNSVRRSNSFAGRPCMGNVNVPCSSFNHGSKQQLHFLPDDNVIRRDPPHHICNSSTCSLKVRQSSAGNNCVSLNHLCRARNSTPFVDQARRRSNRRCSTSFDRRNVIGISSRSTLNRRKQAARYSASPQSISKAVNQQSSAPSHHADPPSCHSSNFSAESYNSFNLMAQQMGGRWRDICRTRMTLHDAMMWANSAQCSAYHTHSKCTQANLCQQQQFHVPDSRIDSAQCCPRTPNYVDINHLDQNLSASHHTPQFGGLLKSIPSIATDYQTNPTITETSKAPTISPTSIPLNGDSSDEFNSEDEVESERNSPKNPDVESGEFCSEDEIVSLIDSTV